MFRKVLLILAVLLLVLAAGFVMAQEDEEYPHDPVFDDGRLNAYDIAAPMAVYYTTKAVPQANFWEDGYKEIITGLELYQVDPLGNGHLILKMTSEELRAAVAEGTMTFEAGMFTLGVGENGWYWVTCPPDAEGKVYYFKWDDMGRTLAT